MIVRRLIARRCARAAQARTQALRARMRLKSEPNQRYRAAMTGSVAMQSSDAFRALSSRHRLNRIMMSIVRIEPALVMRPKVVEPSVVPTPLNVGVLVRF